MAEIDFPDEPVPGEVYDQWTWNGELWVLTPGEPDETGFTFVQPTPPPAEDSSEGDTWYDTSTGDSWVWVDGEWVQFAEGGGGSGFTFVQADEPVAENPGDTWFDTDTDESWVWTGTEWVLFASGAAGSGFTFTQDDPPVAEDTGDTWFQTSTGNSFVWVDDGTSLQWVQFAPGSGGGGGGGSTLVEVGNAVGTITAWSGDTIPGDCLICDGQPVPGGADYDTLRLLVGANVPDLRDRFLLGASAAHAIRTVGGEASHVLVPGEMPSHTHIQNAHNHNYVINDAIMHPYASEGGSGGYVPLAYIVNGTKRGYGMIDVAATNQATGGDGAHNNMPPWYAVVFIIQAKPRLASIAAIDLNDGMATEDFVTEQDALRVLKAGDTMTGNLAVPSLNSTGNITMGPSSRLMMGIGLGVIDFAEEIGDKILLYGSDYKLGVAGSTLRYDSYDIHQFVSNGVERARFSAAGLNMNGYPVFGVSELDVATLDVSGNSFTAGSVNGYTMNVNGPGIAYVGATTGGGSANLIGFRWNSGSIVGVIDNVAAVWLAASSDRRMKRNITDYDRGLDLIMSLHPVEYQLRDYELHGDAPLTFTDAEDDTVHVGLVADEVQWVAPWAVLGEEGDPNQVQSVGYVQLVAPLIAAVQEQQKIIESLTARLEALEAAP